MIVPTLLLASLAVFFLIRFIPGNIIDLMVAQQSPVSDLNRDEVEHSLGFDVPVHVQYVRWLGALVRGDLGTSLWGKTSISHDIAARLPVTFELGILSLVIALIVGLPIGIFSAVRQDTLGDYLEGNLRLSGGSAVNGVRNLVATVMASSATTRVISV